MQNRKTYRLTIQAKWEYGTWRKFSRDYTTALVGAILSMRWLGTAKQPENWQPVGKKPNELKHFDTGGNVAKRMVSHLYLKQATWQPMDSLDVEWRGRSLEL